MTRKWVYDGVEFGPGDRVKVVRFEQDFAPNGMGKGIPWQNNWVHRDEEPARPKEGEEVTLDANMDGAIGNEFVINHIDSAGVVFTDFVDHGYESEFSAGLYAYPLSVLEKVIPFSKTLH